MPPRPRREIIGYVTCPWDRELRVLCYLQTCQDVGSLIIKRELWTPPFLEAGSSLSLSIPSHHETQMYIKPKKRNRSLAPPHDGVGVLAVLRGRLLCTCLLCCLLLALTACEVFRAGGPANEIVNAGVAAATGTNALSPAIGLIWTWLGGLVTDDPPSQALITGSFYGATGVAAARYSRDIASHCGRAVERFAYRKKEA